MGQRTSRPPQDVSTDSVSRSGPNSRYQEERRLERLRNNSSEDRIRNQNERLESEDRIRKHNERWERLKNSASQDTIKRLEILKGQRIFPFMEGAKEHIAQEIYLRFLGKPDKLFIPGIHILLTCSQIPGKTEEFSKWQFEILCKPPEGLQTLLSEDDYNFVKANWGNFTCAIDRIRESVQSIDCLASFEETLKSLHMMHCNILMNEDNDFEKNHTSFIQAEGKRLIIKYSDALKTIDSSKRGEQSQRTSTYPTEHQPENHHVGVHGAIGSSQGLGQSDSQIKIHTHSPNPYPSYRNNSSEDRIRKQNERLENLKGKRIFPFMEGVDEQTAQEIYLRFLGKPDRLTIPAIYNLLNHSQIPVKSQEFLNWQYKRLGNPPEDLQALLSKDDYNFVKAEWGNFTCVTDRILKSERYIDCMASFEETLKYLPLISEKNKENNCLFLQAEGKRLIIKYTDLVLQDPTVWIDNDPMVLAGELDLSVEGINEYSIRDQVELWQKNASNVYPNFSSPKGKCLIINNHRFATMKDRQGTEVDCKNVSNLFGQLGYIVIVHNDLTKEEMDTAFCKFAQDKTHGQSLVVIVLTHGENQAFVGTDGENLNINYVLSQFNGKNARHLTGKPKIFLFQACHEGDYDYGDALNEIDHTDGISSLTCDMKQAKSQKLRLPCESDFFIAYSTVSNYVSYRSHKYGSWFIQAICEVFSRHAKEYDICDMMGLVNRRIVHRKSTSEMEKQTPEFSSRLRKKFYFFPGVLSQPA